MNQQIHKYLKKFITFVLFILTWPLRTIFPAKLKTEHVKILANNKLLHETLKIVVLSDFHWDDQPRTNQDLMKQVIKNVNNLDADLVLLTGDFVQLEPFPIVDLASGYLSKIISKYGIFAVLGNHDYKRNANLIRNTLQENGIKVLTNEKAIPFKGVEVYGVGDFRSQEFIPEKILPKEELASDSPFRIVMSHNPDSAKVLGNYPIDLVVSGHSHGGQVCVPSFLLGKNSGPKYTPLIPVAVYLLNLLPSFIKKRLPGDVKRFGSVVDNWDWGTGGIHVINSRTKLYTNRGLATHPPLRLFCDPEITLIEVN